jgi:hypothetical protein
MALKKSEKRLLVILGVAVLVFLFDRFVLSKGDKESEDIKKTPPKKVVSTVVPNTESSETTSQLSSRTQLKHFEEWGKDPFSINRFKSPSEVSSSSGQKVAKSSVKLKGIFWKEGETFVLINDFILGEGEENKGLRVEKINGTEVLCSRGNRTFKLTWRESP